MSWPLVVFSFHDFVTCNVSNTGSHIFHSFSGGGFALSEQESQREGYFDCGIKIESLNKITHSKIQFSYDSMCLKKEKKKKINHSPKHMDGPKIKNKIENWKRK